MSSAAIVVAPTSSSSTSSSTSSSLMDAAFMLDEGGRASFLQILMQNTGSTYICLWSCITPASCFCSLDGYYQEEGGSLEPSPSAGSVARRLFDEYLKSLIIIENNPSHIPGYAYCRNHPYVEMNEDELPRLATNNTQRQFYQEARIKSAVFLGCRSGEIELGFSRKPQADLQMKMRDLFPEDFARQVSLQELPSANPEQQNPHSSSSSSLRSMSMDSPEYSSLLFNFPSNPYVPDPFKEAAVDDQPIVSTQQPNTDHISLPRLQALQSFTRISNLPFPTPGSEHDVMTKAFLAVISSPSSSTSSSQNQQNPGPSAFRAYSSALLPTSQMKLNVRKRDNMMKRAITYFRGLQIVRSREQRQQGGGRPTTTQLHHMMSERKRREKLNESFLALKSLLPPGTKRDKASVLTTAREFLASLLSQIEELREKNAALEAQHSPGKKAVCVDDTSNDSTTSRFSVRVRQRQVQEPTSTQDRTIDLHVSVRGECPSLQLVIRVLEFLKQLENVHLVSMDADTNVSGPETVNRVNLRLRIEGNEWDESAFQEAVRRVVADLAQ